MGLSLEVKLLAILALLAALFAGGRALVVAHDRRAVADVEAGYARQALKATEAAVAEGDRRDAAQQEISNEAQRQTALARAHAGDTGPALERLQQRATLALGGGIAPHPAAAGGSAPAADPAGMCVDLLGRVGQLARRYAAIADERGIAGSACQASYEALNPAAQAPAGAPLAAASAPTTGDPP
jgi:hypothetical protein